MGQILPCADMLYAVGQGALAVQCRAGDAALLAALAPHCHAETYCRILAERSFLKTLGTYGARSKEHCSSDSDSNPATVNFCFRNICVRSSSTLKW